MPVYLVVSIAKFEHLVFYINTDLSLRDRFRGSNIEAMRILRLLNDRDPKYFEQNPYQWMKVITQNHQNLQLDSGHKHAILLFDDT